MRSALSLSSMFGLMTTLNSVVTIGAGLTAQLAVTMSDAKISPFIAAVISLDMAFCIMRRHWLSHFFRFA